MCGHPLTTVSKIFLHKLYKIVPKLFLESLKLRKTININALKKVKVRKF
jgi:hypothetical protein